MDSEKEKSKKNLSYAGSLHLVQTVSAISGKEEERGVGKNKREIP